MLSVDSRVPRQSPRACRSLAKLNAAWKCLSGVGERLCDYASPYTRSYSVRRACTGSRREARRAGARQARTVTANSAASTPERTTESRGLVPCSIDWKMRVAAKLNSKPRPRPNSAGAQTQTIEQHQLQELIALRTECDANCQHRSFGETQRAGRCGIIQGACYCALKVPRNLLKLLI